jgi:hypothetical protein
LAATLIFAATYFVLAVGRLPGLRIDRTGAAIAGAAAMLACNVLARRGAPGDKLRYAAPAVRNDDRRR